jgi:dienelactone hydrolase
MLAALVLAAVLQENVASRVDPAQTYTLFLPSSYDPAKKHPLLFVFDPRGRGAPAAEIFREAAEEHGWIVVSANGTRSDAIVDPNEAALQALYPDTLRRYAVDEKRVYATGFSGTAMVSWSFGMVTNALAGVIAVGGRMLDALPPRDFKFANYGFAGETDFNNREMRLVDSKMTAPHRFQSFEGGHRWITPALAREALTWFEVLAIKQNLRPRDDAFIAAAYARDVAAAKAMPPREALRRYIAIVQTFDGLHAVDDARAEVARLEKDPNVRREIEAEAKWDAFEERYIRETFTRVGFIVASLRENPSPDLKGRFMREYRVAEMKNRAKKEGAEGRTARRILEAIYGQMNFYLPRQFDERGEKALAEAVRAVAAEIRK